MRSWSLLRWTPATSHLHRFLRTEAMLEFSRKCLASNSATTKFVFISTVNEGSKCLNCLCDILQSPDVTETTPKSLYLMAALLIREGFITVEDLYLHVSVFLNNTYQTVLSQICADNPY